MSLFPKDDKARKNLPVFRMIAGYFPKALREITRVCVANNVRYNPDRKPADINWARGKSTDQLGSLFRHLLEYEVDGQVFEELPPEVKAATGDERVYVLAEAAWRALAALELCIEEQEAKVPMGTLERAMVAQRVEAEVHSRSDLPPILNCQCSECNCKRRIVATRI